MITWSTLTAGLVGSVVAAVATFLVAVLTLRVTRRSDLRREDVRRAERAESDRQAVVAQVFGTLRALETEVRTAPLLRGRSAGRMLEATVRFFLSEHVRHPAVAMWLLSRHEEYQEVVERWHKVWWIPWLNRRRIQDVGDYLGKVIGTLLQWSVGRIPDGAFANADGSPRDLEGVIAEAEQLWRRRSVVDSSRT